MDHRLVKRNEHWQALAGQESRAPGKNIDEEFLPYDSHDTQWLFFGRIRC